MSSLADERSEPPRPPKLSAIVASLLELSMVVTFAANGSAFGLLLCAAYAWFSATWSLFEKRPPD